MTPIAVGIDPTIPHIRVTGETSIARPGKPLDFLTGGTATVLNALVASRGKPISCEEIADLCWPDDKPSHWRGLISFYRRWLQKRLPSGWTIEGIDKWELCSGHGRIDAWQRADLDPTATLDAPDSASQRCESHRIQHATIPELIEQHDHSFITGNSSATAVLALRKNQPTGGPRHHYVIASSEPSPMPFGDFAVAFAPIRWPLLDISGGSSQSQVARAWRMTSDYLATLSQAERQNIVVVDADRLDDFSLRLLAEIVRFPPQQNPGIVVTGDPLNQRPSWQSLLGQLERASYSHITMCDTCSPQDAIASGVVTLSNPGWTERLAS